jgi:hypothetical protein
MTVRLDKPSPRGGLIAASESLEPWSSPVLGLIAERPSGAAATICDLDC